MAIVIRYPGSRSYPNTTIVVVGGLSNGMTYVLDGGTHNEAFNNLGLPLPFPDAMQEFKVETSARSTCSATVQYNNPVSALNNSNFGLITSAADARVIQLALKYTF